MPVSRGFTYGYHANAQPCEKIDRQSVMINGEPIKLDENYRVVANNFLVCGGDRFLAFKKVRSQTVVGLDIDALQAYLTERSPLQPDRTARISRLE